MPLTVSIIMLGSQLVMPVADRMPKFDIAKSCKLDVAATAGLSVDQSIKSCVNDEQKARRQLGAQWSKFLAPSRQSCISQEGVGGTPSYVSLLTCLQMGQWTRRSPSVIFVSSVVIELADRDPYLPGEIDQRYGASGE
jgi:hypothetical protein